MLIAAGRNAVLLLRLDTIMIKRKGGEILGEQRAGQAENKIVSPAYVWTICMGIFTTLQLEHSSAS